VGDGGEGGEGLAAVLRYGRVAGNGAVRRGTSLPMVSCPAPRRQRYTMEFKIPAAWGWSPVTVTMTKAPPATEILEMLSTPLWF